MAIKFLNGHFCMEKVFKRQVYQVTLMKRKRIISASKYDFIMFKKKFLMAENIWFSRKRK